MLLHLLGLFITIIILSLMYIKLKHRFWSIQPVFHFYDLYYWIYNIGIINHELPEKNRYTNFKNIHTIKYTNCSKNTISKMVHFIQSHYLNNGNNKFHPKKENVIPYFNGHNAPCFFSFYKEATLLEDIKNNSTIDTTKIIGVMTTRPLYVEINNGNSTNKMIVYYVDYLCVDKLYRKKNIAPQLIQTHHYNQSYQNKDVSVSLFKREGELTGIIPLTAYTAYCYNMKNWINVYKLIPTISMLIGTKENIYYLYDFIKTHKNKWNITILPEMSNFIELVSSQNIYVIMILKDNDIQCAYIFRKLCTFIEKEKEIISCIASIKEGNVCNEDFIYFFKVGLSHIVQKIHIFHYLNIENISDNYILIQNISMKTKPFIVSPNAYFFYNFAYQPFESKKVFILN